jgi:ABC-type nitrate/sulfonate/bicarbonate transport system substrate-binding protein
VAPQANTRPLRIAYISGGFPVWALWVAQSQGLFAANGLRCELTQTGSSVAQMQGLQAGQFDIGLQLPDHVVRATLRGSPLCILAAQAHAPDVALMAAPHIVSLPDLRQQRIAVDGARSGYALLLSRLLADHGFRAQDVTLVEVGGSQERVDALRQGDVQASFINPPLDKGLEAAGFRRLTSTREAFPGYPGPVVAARRDWAEAHAELARAFQRSWTAAWQWLLDAHNAGAARELAVQHLSAEPASADRALQGLQRLGMPQLSAEGLAQVVDLVYASEAPSAARPEASTFIWT